MNNNNMMELNTEKSQKRKEKEEKKEERLRKKRERLELLKEEKEERLREKEAKKRLKEEKKKGSVPEEPSGPPLGGDSLSPTPSFPPLGVSGPSTTPPPPPKLPKVELNPLEKKKQQIKRKKFLQAVLTIPEVIIVIILAIFCKSKYISYSKNVHQVLNYSSGDYVYEIKRDNEKIRVKKSTKEGCVMEPCEIKELEEYNINFKEDKMKMIRFFLDIKFQFKSKTLSITKDDFHTFLSRNCIYSMIHNKENFLSFQKYKKYEISDYEQMSSYTTRGYQVKQTDGNATLTIAMGEKQSSGYAMVVNSAYKIGNDLYVYIEEQIPSKEEQSLTVITHPMLQLQMSSSFEHIYVYNVETGEAFPNLDAQETTPNPQAKKEETIQFGTSLIDLLT